MTSRTEERKGIGQAQKIQLLEGDMDRVEARVSRLMVTAVSLLGSAFVGVVLSLISVFAK